MSEQTATDENEQLSCYRRQLLALSSMAIATTSGCLRYLGLGEESSGSGSGDNSSTNNNSTNANDSANFDNESGSIQEENQSATDTSQENASKNESGEEYPEAANPEPADNSPNESAYAGNESQARDPTQADIEVVSHELKTDASGATVEATFKNTWRDTIDVLDVEVVFLENGTQATSVVWGTNNLEPGGEWSYPFRAKGPEYSSVDNYEIYIANIQ